MQSKRHKARVLSLQIALAVIAAGCTQSSDEFRIDQGIVVRQFSDTGKLANVSLAQRTTTISKKALLGQSASERKGLGYIVTAPAGVDYFEVYSVSHLPGAPGKIGGSLTEGERETDLKTSSRMFHKLGYEAFDLDENDPLGEYRIDVFVDGKLRDTLVFEVTP